MLEGAPARLAWGAALSCGAHAVLLSTLTFAPLWQGPGPGRAARVFEVRLEQPALAQAERSLPRLRPEREATPERGEAAAAPLPAAERYYTSREVDERAEPLNVVDIAYPERALRERVSGSVKLRLLIDRRGTVREASVIESEPRGVFEEEALRAARSLRFRPATRAGAAVGSIKLIEVPFEPNCNLRGSCAD